MSAHDVPTPAPAHDPEPVPPREPDLSECCGNGCEPCIFDVYAMDRQRYLADLKAWQASHSSVDAGPDVGRPPVSP